VVQSRGVRFGERPTAPEQIAARWSEINDMSNPEAFSDAMIYGAKMFDLR